MPFITESPTQPVITEEQLEKMERERKRLAKKYGLDGKSLTTEYLIGRIEYEEANGSLRKRLQNSIRLNFVQAFAILPLVACVLYLATQKTHVIPYVIELLNGHPIGVGTAVTGPSSLEEATREQLLRDWIENARIVLSDWNAQTRLIHKVMAQSSGSAYQFMTNWYTETRPDKRAKNEQVNAHVTNVLRVSAQTYEVEWTEDAYNADGLKTGTERWKGWFRTNIDPAKDLASITQNPVGFAVTQVSWSKIQ